MGVGRDELFPTRGEASTREGVRAAWRREVLLEVLAEALAAAKNGVATADKSLPAEFCKCMLEDEAALAVCTEFLQRTWNSGSWDGGMRPVEDIQVDLRDWDTMSQKEQLQWAEKLDLRLHWMQDNPKDPGPDRASHTRYETYKKATKLSEAGKRRQHLRKRVIMGYVSVTT